MIIDKVRSTINKYNLLQEGDKVVLGLSGGPDSVCLLHILKQLESEYKICIYVFKDYILFVKSNHFQ
jgi:tRNA(Ile)-lysidine synthase